MSRLRRFGRIWRKWSKWRFEVVLGRLRQFSVIFGVFDVFGPVFGPRRVPAAAAGSGRIVRGARGDAAAFSPRVEPQTRCSSSSSPPLQQQRCVGGGSCSLRGPKPYLAFFSLILGQFQKFKKKGQKKRQLSNAHTLSLQKRLLRPQKRRFRFRQNGHFDKHRTHNRGIWTRPPRAWCTRTRWTQVLLSIFRGYYS